jgi:hypothetical protein
MTAWFPKGIVYDTAISTPVPCSFWHTIHLGLGRPLTGYPYKHVTAYHITQGRVEYESTTPLGTVEGLDLWEACNRIESHVIISFLVHAGIGVIIELLIHI